MKLPPILIAIGGAFVSIGISISLFTLPPTNPDDLPFLTLLFVVATLVPVTSIGRALAEENRKARTDSRKVL